MAYLATKKICVSADKSKVVPCSTQGAVTLAEEGDIVSHDDAVKYELWGPMKKPASKPAPASSEDVEAVEEEPEEKTVSAAPANKAVAATPQNKGNAGKK